MVAPSTSATMPVPIPTTTPQSAMSCQTSVIAIEPRIPETIIAIADTTTGRTPKRLMRAAANGPISPNRASRTASATEISSVLQPNSFSSGWMMTPGAPMAPAVASMTRNVAPATNQP